MRISRNKKGDLSLSVNAIVILVIAIIFLGLAIGFTTKLLNKSKDKLESGLDIDISQPANSENPMTFDGKFQVKAGDKAPVKISFYNEKSTALNAAKPVLANCTGAGLNLTAIATKIEGYKEARFQTQLSAASTAATGDYICNLKIMDGTTEAYVRQIPVTVTS